MHVDAITLGHHACDYRPGAAVRPAVLVPANKRRTFAGYPRADGSVGTRNYLGIISTVSCSGDVAQMIADAVSRQLLPHYPGIDGVVAVTHGSGCCLAPGGEGLAILQRTLGGYARNPNFGGIVLVGLGCEVNLIENILDVNDLIVGPHVQALTIQQEGGTAATVQRALSVIASQLPGINEVGRQTVSAEHLVVALQCGGSDAYSGITANPALGAAVDLLIANGGTAILGETPEIYGAEHLLIERAATAAVAEQLAERIRWWESYTALHGAEINNNPTPGNRAGGISTILEKSLGAVAKGGTTTLQAVFRYAEQIDRRGLVFMDTPGYDVVSLTGMIAGGANLVCFTTGRGSVCGFRPVPTLKLAAESSMYRRLEPDMDINCGTILEGDRDIDSVGREIFEKMLLTASGQQSKSERQGFGGAEFVPWQMGAIL